MNGKDLIILIKFKLNLYTGMDWKNIKRIEEWFQLRYKNEIHTAAACEQIIINNEIKNNIPIHMSKLYDDWKTREDYYSLQREFQEM